MNVKVARDGVEIGECRRQELDQLARAGQVLPTDHYWLEGMEEWKLLSDLLASKTWRLAAPRRISRGPLKVARGGVEIGEYGREELDELAHTGRVLRTDHYWREGMEEWQPVGDILNPDPWTRAVSPPIFRARGLVAAAIGCLAAVAAGFAFYLLVVLPARLPDKPAPASAPNPDLDRTDTGLRSRATAELIARLNKLPNMTTTMFLVSLSIGLLSFKWNLPAKPEPAFLNLAGGVWIAALCLSRFYSLHLRRNGASKASSPGFAGRSERGTGQTVASTLGCGVVDHDLRDNRIRAAGGGNHHVDVAT